MLCLQLTKETTNGAQDQMKDEPAERYPIWNKWKKLYDTLAISNLEGRYKLVLQHYQAIFYILN